MANAKRTPRKIIDAGDVGRQIKRIKGGQLAHVNIVRPRTNPGDVDLKAVRKALRAYFRGHPEALERS
jgi:hypothetical protein